jgi:protein SCO1/2
MSACAPARAWHGAPYTSPTQAPGFSLQDTQGDVYRLDARRGQVVLLYFGYTNCPDECPAVSANVHQTFVRLGGDASHVDFVFVTVDPQRDTPTVLRQFLDRFDSRFIGLYPSLPELQAIESAYGVYASVEAEGGTATPVVTHTSRLLLIDASGVLRTSYDVDITQDDLLADIRRALAR